MKLHKFYIYYGGYFSDTWEIKWEEKELRCYHYEYGPESYSVIDYEPRLVEYIDALSGITQHWWVFDYSTDICDGTQWEIDIRVGKHKFKFYGSNDYPRNFKEFIQATRIFLSDNAFANTPNNDDMLERMEG